MNNILFGAIGVLMLTITGIGAAELKVQAHQSSIAQSESSSGQILADTSGASVDVTEQQPASTVSGSIVQAVEKAGAAVSGDWSDDDDEYDYDDDEDDRPTQAVAQQQSVAQTAPAAKPTATQTGATAGTYTMAQVAAHNTAASCYSAISGLVYDLTPFISQHPGGAAAIKSLCGVDGTAAYTGQHGGSRRPANELASLKIGVLAQ